jgi:hypothetical protein
MEIGRLRIDVSGSGGCGHVSRVAENLVQKNCAARRKHAGRFQLLGRYHYIPVISQFILSSVNRYTILVFF